MTKYRGQIQRKSLAPIGGTNDDVRCLYATAAFDRVAIDMERKWGIGGLPGLVSPSLADKYAKALGYLNDAIGSGDHQRIATEGENCAKGLLRMDAEATAAGHQPNPPEVWQIVVGGRVCALVREMTDWPKVAARHPGMTIYSLQEVANALACYGQTVVAVKDAFPGAEVTATRPKSQLAKDLEDEIPF
jgi:hypothetical protein